MSHGARGYPSRETLAALAEAIQSVRRSAILGLVRPLDESRLARCTGAAAGVSLAGNVRELRNILERASILCDGGLITPDHVAISARPRPAQPAVQAAPARSIETSPSRSLPVSSAGELKSMERDMIEQALQRVRFNKSKAAKDLGLTRQQLYLRMKKYGLE